MKVTAAAVEELDGANNYFGCQRNASNGEGDKDIPPCC